MQQPQRQSGPPSSARGTVFSQRDREGTSGADLLTAAATRHQSLLSIGLEPCEAYLPRGFAPDLAGYEQCLRLVVEATAGFAAAYKFNLAFFEALGPRGIDLLHKVRAELPRDVLVIADGKRGDIGTTAEHYARALYESLGADSATVNPLMGRDACEPFLAYADKLTFLLVLTSNPGADDFLVPGGLYREIAQRGAAWNTRANVGFVVGATRAERVSEIRSIAGEIPFLVPGIGAQGGELEAVVASGMTSGACRASRACPSGQAVAPGDKFSGLLFHVTRGVLPSKDEAGDPGALIRAKTMAWRDRINAAVAARERSDRVDV